MADGEVTIENLNGILPSVVPDNIPNALQTGEPNKQPGMKFLLKNLVECEVAVAMLKRKFVTRDELEAVIARLEKIEREHSRLTQWTSMPGRNDN
jgi:hypothetical protein